MAKGFSFVEEWMKDLRWGELAKWLERRRSAYASDQIQYVDAVSECYRPIFKHLPQQPQRLLALLCERYTKGMMLSDLVEASGLHRNVCWTQLSRLVSAGVVIRIGRGRYRADMEILRYHAFFNDIRFRPGTDPSTAVDHYVKAA